MFYLIQAGATLQAMNDAGTIVAITLPSGVTVSASKVMKAAVLARQLLVVYAPSKNLWIDPVDLTARSMAILPPSTVPTVAAGGSAGVGLGLTGKFMAKYSFAIKDSAGTIKNESPKSDSSLEVTLTDQKLAISAITVSADADVNCRRIYRTAADGTVFFHDQDIDDNVTTAIETATSDAALSLLPADPDIQLPPGSVNGTALRIITQWKGRAWAVSDAAGERDDVIYTLPNKFYAWAQLNNFPINPGEDSFGVVAFAARRDALGILKRTRVVKIVGSTEAGFEPVDVAEKIGCVAVGSVIVVRDKAYWLGLDGVYRWDDDGVVNLTRATVDPWFTTDTYFNRERFPNAFMSYDPLVNMLKLNLAAVGASTENRWIGISLEGDDPRIFGPYQTAAFTPTARVLSQDDESRFRPLIGGSDGYVYLENQTVSSDIAGGTLVASAISSLAKTKWHSKKNPKVTHYFGELSVLSRIESAGALVITPYVGGLDAGAGATFSHDLTLGYERLGRLGVGRLASLEFSQATAGRRWLVFGYDIEPLHEVGWR